MKNRKKNGGRTVEIYVPMKKKRQNQNHLKRNTYIRSIALKMQVIIIHWEPLRHNVPFTLLSVKALEIFLDRLQWTGIYPVSPMRRDVTRVRLYCVKSVYSGQRSKFTQPAGSGTLHFLSFSAESPSLDRTPTEMYSHRRQRTWQSRTRERTAWHRLTGIYRSPR